MKRTLSAAILGLATFGLVSLGAFGAGVRAQGPGEKSIEQLIETASMGGKYQNLLRVLHAPADRARHGAVRDFGKWNGSTYAGHTDLPSGYWSYAYPYWFIWGSARASRPWAAANAAGAPSPTFDPAGSDAWSPNPAAGNCSLSVRFARSVRAVGVIIRLKRPETLLRITILDGDVERPQRRDGISSRLTRGMTAQVSPISTPTPIAGLRLYFTPRGRERLAVDAVGLIDAMGIAHWASAATASVVDGAVAEAPVAAARPASGAAKGTVEEPRKGGALGGRRAGRRGLRRRFGGEGTAHAVDAGLSWLARHQSAEGHWDCDGFGEECKGNVCDGKGHAVYDVGLTGLGLLAFLGAGHTHQAGKYKTTVRNAIRYLRRVQDPEGCFGVQSGHFMYNHAIATTALSEAYAMSRSHLLRRPVEAAVAYLLKAQNRHPSGSGKFGWRYTVQPGDNDTSCTTWATMALKSAKTAGIKVDDEAFEGALRWIDVMTDKNSGRIGYVQSGISPVRAPGREEKWPRSRSEAITAAGITTRILCGVNPQENDAIRKGMALILDRLPRYDARGGIDHYYWYFGTLATFQVGGQSWRTWNKALKKALVAGMRTEGCEAGSWDPLGPWGAEGGRVYATAMMTMCLEVYYRYGKVFGTK